MLVKGLKDEDFVNYHKPSMFLGIGTCDWKCCIEQGIDTSICQNYPLALAEPIKISYEDIYQRYITNPITNAVVIGGLEPILQFQDVIGLLNTFRANHSCHDDFVIYTGYYPEEIQESVNALKQFDNVIVKFGRYLINQDKHFDPVLGVYLASNNQYATRIS